MKTHFYKIFLLPICVMLFSTCARNPVTGKREVMLMSKKQEVALGSQSDPSIVAQYGLYENKELQTFIQQKGAAMAKISHMPKLDFHFKVLDSPVVNAFALPGGYVYFTRGILAHFNNEAQFAGVLGHEISHVTARHSAKAYTKQMVAQVGFMAGVIASEKFRQFAEQANQGIGLLFLKFGRDAESQSDLLGVEYSTEINYDAHEMADFFETLDRLQSQSGQTIPDFLSTHPNPANRHTEVHKHATEAQSKVNKARLKINKDNYLRMIDGMTYGEDPKQGYLENNVFYHPELLFEFKVPNSWNLVNTPTQVQMAPTDGTALMMLTLSAEKNLDAAAQAVVQENELQVIESQKTTVNGLPAITMVSQQTTTANGQSQVIKIATYLIKHGNSIYIIHGMSLNADFNRHYNKFIGTMESFKKLTDSNKINVSAKKIKVKSNPKTQTVKAALLAMGASNAQLNELAILNGLHLTEQLTSGEKVKMIE